jgi:hypothetical protein
VAVFATGAVAAAAAAAVRFACGGRLVGGPAGGGENRKPFAQFRRTAMRAPRALPSTGAHQHFAVFFALSAMKFVNRHKHTISGGGRNSRRIIAES